MRDLMTTILGLILVLTGIAGTADAANFTDSSIGISIDVDEALTKQPRLRHIQYFKSADKSASLMVNLIHDLSIVDFLGELRNIGYRNSRDGIDLGINGKPIEADIESGRGLLIPVRGLIRGQPIRGVVGAYSGQDGQGFIVIGSARPELWKEWQPRMKTMFDSVRFVKLDHAALIKDWESRIMNKKLQHKQASFAGAVHLEHHLCSDGAVTRRPGMAGLLPGPAMPSDGSGMNQGRGMWQVTVLKGAPYLIVRDGREQELMLEDVGENFLLNGQPYQITASDLCK